jgi:hypothetical protein
MAESKKHPEYALHDLAKALTLSWHEFAEWLDPRLPDVLGSAPSPRIPYCEFVHGFHSRWDVRGYVRLVFPARWDRDALVLAEVARACEACGLDRLRKPASEKPADSPLNTKVVGLLTAVASLVRRSPNASQRIREDPEYGKRRGQELRAMFLKMVGLRREVDRTLRHLSETKSGVHRSRKKRNLAPLRWARWLMRRPADLERAFWAQVQSGLRSYVKSLSPVSDALRETRGLEAWHYELLSRVLTLGTLAIRPYWDAGQFSVRLVMEPRLKGLNDAVEECIQTVVVHVAYGLAREAVVAHEWPIFSVKCRNPFCRKKFYTARESAVTCPSTRQGRRSECKAVWEAFRAWLRKATHDPNVAWRDPVLRKQFKAQYRPRGSQSGIE